MTRRRARTSRPLCEALEGRALMAYYTTLDPTFGTGGVALGAANNLGVSALPIAVQALSGGKVLVAEANSSTASPIMDVARYNADGSLDTTFGTGGRANIPLPAGFSSFVTKPQFGTQPQNMAVLPDESIAVGATATGGNGGSQSFVVRLTATGTLDPSFGTGGEVLLPQALVNYAGAVASAGGGSIVIAGIGSDAGGSDSTAVVARLTPTGTFDATFNGTGVVELTLPGLSITGIKDATVVAVAVDKDGRIVLGGTVRAPLFPVPGPSYFAATGFVARVTSAGTPDPAFGSGGVVAAGLGSSVADLAVQGDGKVVLAGGSSGSLTRLDVDGSIDASFSGVAPALAAGQQVSTLDSVAIGPDGEITASGSQSFFYGTGRLLVARFRADGTPDASFGAGGVARIAVKSPESARLSSVAPAYTTGLVVADSGEVLVVGATTSGNRSRGLVARIRPVATSPLANDYDYDGKADIAAQLANPAYYAIRPSGGGPDVVQPFGGAGVGASIPAPGDYDGDGRTDLAVYLPAAGAFAIKPASGDPAYLRPFGSAGVGNTIPVAGDFDGDGKADIAAYLPAAGAFAVKPSDGTPAYLAPFGSAGAGASIPVAADFDGDGKADIAVYLPAAGAFAVKPSDGTPAYLAPFGSAGAGNTIPVAGDFDGDGKADIAVYLPAAGVFAIKPSGGATPAYLVPFGGPGAGATVPVASTPGTLPGGGGTVSASAVRGEAGVYYFLTDEVLAQLGGKAAKKPAVG